MFTYEPLRVAGVGGGKDVGSDFTNLLGLSMMDVGGCVVADPGVPVLIVVPDHERFAERSGVLQAAEALREVGPVGAWSGCSVGQPGMASVLVSNAATAGGVSVGSAGYSIAWGVRRAHIPAATMPEAVADTELVARSTVPSRRSCPLTVDQ